MGWNRFRRSSEEMHDVVASATNESKHFGTERQLRQQGSRGVILSPAMVKVGEPKYELARSRYFSNGNTRLLKAELRACIRCTAQASGLTAITAGIAMFATYRIQECGACHEHRWFDID